MLPGVRASGRVLIAADPFKRSPCRPDFAHSDFLSLRGRPATLIDHAIGTRLSATAQDANRKKWPAYSSL